MSKEIATVGIGKWGKNLLGEFSKVASVNTCVSTGNEENLRWLREKYPEVKHTTKMEDVLNDRNIEAVAIATPINTHYELALAALTAGKHTFVEKPLATEAWQVERLIEEAKKRDRVLFVGYIFLHHEVFEKIKELLTGSTVDFLYTQWKKFGTFQEDVVANLAVHEISLSLALMGKEPVNAERFYEAGAMSKRDVISLGLDFGDGRTSLIYIDRLSPSKSKQVTVVTRDLILVWENDSLYRVKSGDPSPELLFKSEVLPLGLEVQKFLQSLDTREEVVSGGANSLGVARVLEKLRK